MDLKYNEENIILLFLYFILQIHYVGYIVYIMLIYVNFSSMPCLFEIKLFILFFFYLSNLFHSFIKPKESTYSKIKSKPYGE